MLERLRKALVECEAEKAVVEACDFENEIKAEIAEFEAQVRAKYENKKSEKLLDVSYQIKALNSLIEKEEKKLANEAVVNSDHEVLNDEFLAPANE